MTLAEEQIDRIVREVLRRLQAGQADAGPLKAGQLPVGETARVQNTKRVKESERTESGSTTAESDLHLSLPVISVARLEGKLTGVKRLVVTPKAVVTPAAKDLLRERKVELARGAANGKPSNSGKLTLAVGVAETPYDPASLCRELKSDNGSLEELAHTGLATVTEELSEQVARGGRLGLLLTSNVSAAACLANRNRGVRAAEARCPTSTREAIKGVGVNLLVVNPVGKSTFELKRMIQVFLAGAGECPAQWRGKLDN